MEERVKTSFELPKALYVELKKRAAEEGRPVRDVLIEAIENYLSITLERSGEARSRLTKLILIPVEGAGPEDLVEYSYEDVGE
ncbi:MAG: hypothetical protein QW291_00820 [Thermofilaceae archaeon]